ncbi:MAG: hypothetical protein ACTHK1_11805 [Actinomycetales bacterium]
MTDDTRRDRVPPLATELPEIMNAITWVRQGKTRLALANNSGAMMIQATVPSGIGLLFTPWRFDTALLLPRASRRPGPRQRVGETFGSHVGLIVCARVEVASRLISAILSSGVASARKSSTPFSRDRVTPRRLTAAGGFYLVFAASLVLTRT